MLVHHPYHAFDAVTRFVREAAVDPHVLAIKMTLYRVSPASPIAHALHTAVENGKEVAVLVELQARFDEEANIRWARALEEVGAHVVYGLVGFKTHCKACLVVRQEPDGIRRYCHLATGNYNVRTGGVYGDLGLFTSRESFGEDLTALFNLLTGYTRPPGFHHLLLAPTDLRDELDRAHPARGEPRPGRPAGPHHREDERPGRPPPDRGALRGQRGGRADRSHRARHLLPAARRCRALVGQHPGRSPSSTAISSTRGSSTSRTTGSPEYLLASADWMPRNLDRRVEIAFPVLDPALQAQVRQILEIQLADTVKARRILADGTSVRIPRRPAAPRSQERLYELTGERESRRGSPGADTRSNRPAGHRSHRVQSGGKSRETCPDCGDR